MRNLKARREEPCLVPECNPGTLETSAFPHSFVKNSTLLSAGSEALRRRWWPSLAICGSLLPAPSTFMHFSISEHRAMLLSLPARS